MEKFLQVRQVTEGTVWLFGRTRRGMRRCANSVVVFKETCDFDCWEGGMCATGVCRPPWGYCSGCLWSRTLVVVIVVVESKQQLARSVQVDTPGGRVAKGGRGGAGGVRRRVIVPNCVICPRRRPLRTRAPRWRFRPLKVRGRRVAADRRVSVS